MREFSKLNTLINSANILEILQIKAVMGSRNKKLLSRASKIFGGDNKIFNFQKFLTMLCQNLIKTLYVLVVVYIS